MDVACCILSFEDFLLDGLEYMRDVVAGYCRVLLLPIRLDEEQRDDYDGSDYGTDIKE